MLPLLRQMQDGQVHALPELVSALAQKFNLAEQEQNELLPKRSAIRLSQRVGWARTYLKKAGLLEAAGRGTVKIAPAGPRSPGSKPGPNRCAIS